VRREGSFDTCGSRVGSICKLRIAIGNASLRNILWVRRPAWNNLARRSGTTCTRGNLAVTCSSASAGLDGFVATSPKNRRNLSVSCPSASVIRRRRRCHILAASGSLRARSNFAIPCTPRLLPVAAIEIRICSICLSAVRPLGLALRPRVRLLAQLRRCIGVFTVVGARDWISSVTHCRILRALASRLAHPGAFPPVVTS
jgi:hypothetical protein